MYLYFVADVQLMHHDIEDEGASPFLSPFLAKRFIPILRVLPSERHIHRKPVSTLA